MNIITLHTYKTNAPIYLIPCPGLAWDNDGGQAHTLLAIPGTPGTIQVVETPEQIAGLIASASVATSPTEADIDRRVALLRELATSLAPPTKAHHGFGVICRTKTAHYWRSDAFSDDWVETTEAEFNAELRRYAIRALLNERGAQ